ncbi:cytochrome P450 [Mycolicibacterium sp. P1-18]|uniref:cytochrome P450 n=1 Tax=Mycolicibacterium sp. P1-18 TaxID=2024615 RepID=UPI0011F31822|nr:cytochrome P450 [Mycolicibacterium sp. P1-18]KAA0096223.1 cytochrome P450 [Mycolicibacterium sp. P1-18]
MTEATTDEAAVEASKPALPPVVRIPRVVQAAGFVAARRRTTMALKDKYGNAFTLDLPMFGHTVVISDPTLAKQVFTTSTDVLGNVQPNLSRLLGSGSVFGLEGADHRRRRKLLTPPFHGKSIKNYEAIVVEETLRETATWPEGSEFATLEPMMRITLNIILRAVFGAAGHELDDLRRMMPTWITLGSRLAPFPTPKRDWGQWSPWARIAAHRRHYYDILDTLIARARADPKLADRTDVLALFLQSTYEDGSPMSRTEIGDELLTLLAAGHETTASTLAWACERLSRHPDVLAEMADEALTDVNDLRQAAILEVQRVRTIIDFVGRHVLGEMVEVGPWRIPRGYTILVSILNMHADAEAFPDPDRFDPRRFVDAKVNTLSWMPFGGGTRRCVGAAFANMEMDVVLRTVLREFAIEPTGRAPEKWHARGVAYTPKDGGRITVRRRAAAATG